MSTKPNILVIMSDQHAPGTMGFLGHPCVKTPHLDALAARGVAFKNAYCSYPICTPSRASFMTGLLTPQHDVWELGMPLSTAMPTWPHALRTAGYTTSISGRMHFMGPDQMHGFERRVAPDGYIGKSPWAYDPWFKPIEDEHVMLSSVEQAGPSSEPTPNEKTDVRTHDAALKELDYLTKQRDENDAPWALIASYIQPHFPFEVSQKWWDLYEGVEIDMPRPAPGGGPFSPTIPELFQGSRRWVGNTDDGLKAEDIKNARRAYYAMTTLIDDYVGQLMTKLQASGQLENTIVLYISDHGDNMGEHGLWSKVNFYKDSVGVPFIMAGPGIAENQISEAPVSLIDWVPTLLELNKQHSTPNDTPAPTPWPVEPQDMPGRSLWPVLKDPSQTWDDRVIISDYACGGTRVPLRMVRRGKYKACFGPPLPPVLFNLEEDPHEWHDLGQDPAHGDIVAELYAAAQADGWNPKTMLTHIRQQKRTLHFIQQAEAVPVKK